MVATGNTDVMMLPSLLMLIYGTAQDGHQLHCTVSDANNNW
jgi:hypothetical protein